LAKGIATVRRTELRNPKFLEAYLRDHHRKGPEEFRIALREVVLSQRGGFVELSRRTGLARTGLYKALSAKGNPSYSTVQQVLDALGVRTILAVKSPPPRRKSNMEHMTAYTEITADPQNNNVKYKVVQEEQKATKPRILPGSGKGLFVMANDFDAPLPEFSDYM